MTSKDFDGSEDIDELETEIVCFDDCNDDVRNKVVGEVVFAVTVDALVDVFTWEETCQ